jgi:hypothetical protein
MSKPHFSIMDRCDAHMSQLKVSIKPDRTPSSQALSEWARPVCVRCAGLVERLLSITGQLSSRLSASSHAEEALLRPLLEER